MIALDNQPFSIVEDYGFIELMAHLQPRYLIPSRRFFTTKILSDEHDRVIKIIKNEIQTTEHIAFTSDLWTNDNSKNSFLSLTAHWLTPLFKQRNAILRAKNLETAHTGHETEIFKYFSAPTIPRDSEPLDWWRAQTEYPSLKKVAKKFLTSPLSSVYSERLFSEFGNIYEEKRSRILPETGEKLLFLHHNLKLF